LEKKFGTKLINNGNDKCKLTGALSIPIYQASTYHQEDIDDPSEFDYSRSGNPTRKVIEETIAYLEGADRGFAFSSGMAATASVLSIFSAGDHIIASQDIYGGTFRVSGSIFSRFNIDVSFIDTTDIDAIRKEIKSNTKAIFIETPSNPLFKITDIKKVAELAKEHDLITIIDNTFMTPYLQRPIELGIDIIVHSATKFIGGHSDVLGGLVAVKGENLANRVYSIQNSFGAVLGPLDSWLLLRGLKTLKVRLDYQQSSTIKLARWFREQPEIKQVYYPGLENHQGHAVHLSQADGPGAVFSFETVDTKTARRFLKNTLLAAVAVSLGGVETIASYPYKMSHGAMPKETKENLGINDRIIRVSVGLEDCEDLLEDFKNALRG